MANSIEEIVGQNYDILKTVAEGGEAIIYKVKHKQLGYVRALRFYKIPIQGDSNTDETYKYFINECKLLLRLGNGVHPHIIRIAEPKILYAHPTYEMDFLEGQDLDSKLEVEGCFDTPAFLKMLQEMASVLAYCHHDIYQFSFDPNEENDKPFLEYEDPKWRPTKGKEAPLIEKYKVIHNDIHTKNIFAKNDGNFILLDFGLAFEGQKVSRMTRQKGGIYEYMAPEKFDDTKLTTESDVYSFGIVLFECLTGRVPFVLSNAKNPTHSDAHEVWQKHKLETAPEMWPLRQQALFKKGLPATQKDYPDWLETIIKKCLAKKPEDRYKDGKALYDDVIKYTKQDQNAAQKELMRGIVGQLEQQKQTEIDKLRISYEEQKTKLERQKTALEQKQQELLAEEQLTKSLNDKITLKDNTINGLQSKIKAIEAQPATEKIVEKKIYIETLPVKAQQEIDKIKGKATKNMIVTGVVAALLSAGVAYNTVPTKKGEATVDNTAMITDSSVVMDSTATTSTDTQQVAEDVITDFETNIQNADPTEQDFEKLKAIIAEYPDLKSRIYDIYLNEGNRRSGIDANAGANHLAIAQRIQNL